MSSYEDEDGGMSDRACFVLLVVGLAYAFVLTISIKAVYDWWTG